MEESHPKHEWSRNQFCMVERIVQDPNRSQNWNMNWLGNHNLSWRGNMSLGPIRTVCVTGKVNFTVICCWIGKAHMQMSLFLRSGGL